MEADGIALGYDRWRRVGAVRNPLDRTWSAVSASEGGAGAGYKPGTSLKE
jgi:hypothetical protein